MITEGIEDRITVEELQKHLAIFNSELETITLQAQINMRKLTLNDVQLSDLMKTQVTSFNEDCKTNINSLNKLIKNCVNMQDELMQIETLQKKLQNKFHLIILNERYIFRIICEDVAKKKEQELTQLQKNKI